MDFEERIETDLSYMQDQLRQLNEIVTDLQQQVMKLERQNEYLKGKLEELDTEARPNRKPPHY